MRHRVKASVYLPDSILRELEEESARLDRTTLWLLRRAWVIARNEIRRINTMPTPRAKP
jgi:uncharacterized small protein (TIGR04563 family)